MLCFAIIIDNDLTKEDIPEEILYKNSISIEEWNSFIANYKVEKKALNKHPLV